MIIKQKPLTGDASAENIIEAVKTSDGRVEAYALLIRHGLKEMRGRKNSAKTKYDNAKLVQSTIEKIGAELSQAEDKAAVAEIRQQLNDLKSRMEGQDGGIARRSDATPLPLRRSPATH